MTAIPALFGALLAGAGIGVITRAIESSRIAFGPYALYGNGALAVPATLAPVAFYALWVSLVRAQRVPVAGMTASILGLDLGAGIAYNLLAQRPFDVASIVLGWGIFIVPTGLVAAITLWLLVRSRVGSSRVALAVVFVAGFVLASLPPLSFVGGFGAIGISVAAAVVAARDARTPLSVAAVGAAVFAAALAQVFAIPLIFLPRRGG